ncbi:hypothetical protein CsatB_021872 [Cannabis sativa]
MEEKRILDGFVSPSSSPPTPPSPLPISVGPGNQKYFFSPSPSLSPPFSPPPSSSHDSTELLHLLQEEKKLPSLRARSAFSLDLVDPDILDSKSSCLKDLLANPTESNHKVHETAD